jgi:hypothetical protein
MSQKIIEDGNFKLNLGIQNNATVKFTQNGMFTTSGKAVACNNIAAGTFTGTACSGTGTSSTATGLVGNASWSYAIPGKAETATLTLDFDMPYDGGNTGSLSGNATFDKYFTIDPSISMPDNGDVANVNATVNIV